MTEHVCSDFGRYRSSIRVFSKTNNEISVAIMHGHLRLLFLMLDRQVRSSKECKGETRLEETRTAILCAGERSETEYILCRQRDLIDCFRVVRLLCKSFLFELVHSLLMSDIACLE